MGSNSATVPMYIVARLFLGFGIPFCIVAASSLMGELGHPNERPILTSLFNACWFIGSILAASITYGTQTIPSDWSWRIPSLLQAIPSLLQVTFILYVHRSVYTSQGAELTYKTFSFIPESPRFLISKDKRQEALDILVKYHAEGDPTAEFPRAEMAQIEETLRIELETSKQSWLDLIRTAGMRRRLMLAMFLGLFTQWSGNTLIA